MYQPQDNCIAMTDHTYIVAALYHFAPLEQYADLQPSIQTLCAEHDIKGTLLLASEGVNGTVAGSRMGIDALLAHLRSIPGLETLVHKESHANKPPFYRMKVRLKKEIVTMGVGDAADPLREVGTYVTPEEWNAIIADPEVILVDTRNDYEYGIGTFKGAIDPKTDDFREFPDFVRENLDPEKHKKVAMFCTGGIRCEKASSYMLNQGFEEVFHLKGGILKYLEEVPEDESLWEGDCFVFDERVSVKHGLEVGDFGLCRGCRWPVSEVDTQSPDYRKGICCPHCVDKLTPELEAARMERQRQIALAKQRAEEHIGRKAE
jgi:UPF0176 protein